MRQKCIKPACSNFFTLDTPDPDYCPECREKNKVIAQQVDSKMSRSSRQAPSFEDKMAGMKKIGGIPIINL